MFADIELNNLGRARLLAAIADYAPSCPDEAATIERFQAFVRAHADCFERSQSAGHITASALILSPDGKHALLMHHRKLNRWLQPGGHADGDCDTARVASREVSEETGLAGFVCRAPIFDLDVHPIPARGDEPAHFHFDVRHLVHADNLAIVGNHESLALRWFSLEEIAAFEEESLRRMAIKALKRRAPTLTPS